MNARSAQLVAATLAFLLIVLVGALIFILLSRPAEGPRPSSSPSPTASVVSSSLLPSLSPSVFPSASTTEIPTISAEPFPSASPIPTAEITPTIPPTPSPTPTIPPTPTPPPVPTSPDREIRVTRFGLDGRNPELGDVRYVLFHVDGPSLIRATLTNSSGRARVCLWQGDDVEGRTCDTIKNGTLDRAVFETGQTSWTLSLIGIEQAIGPVVDLTLDFNANSPSVDVRNVRFQGVPATNYNGITAAVDTNGTGELRVTGNFDVTQQHMYRVQISEAGVGVVKDETRGPVPSFVVTQPVTAVTSYVVTVSNPTTSQEPLPIFLRSTFTWP